MTKPVTSEHGITHRHVQAGSLDMHIAEAGHGPLVLLLHGFPESWYSWLILVPKAEEAHARRIQVRAGKGKPAVTGRSPFC